MTNADFFDPGLSAIGTLHTADEQAVIAAMVAASDISLELRGRAQARAVSLIERIRAAGKPGLMELFLAEYGLSTNEGIALMCLAEALLRVPDSSTIDSLIEDKVAPYSWGEHLGNSSSAIVNASTLGLMLTGRILDEDSEASVPGLLHRVVKRLGEPVVRSAVKRIMREMGHQFVLGQSIAEAIEKGAVEVRRGYRYSYDMLGEGALTADDSQRYFKAYEDAINAIADGAQGQRIADRPGISVKLSALHPRYEWAKEDRLKAELAPRLLHLCRLARDHNLGLNVDAEESQRLAISLNIIETVLSDPSLAGWDGFGVVVQAYQKRAGAVIDWLDDLAARHHRRIMVRLVKGAYWDTEIKQAQVDGAIDYPVFTRRAATDVSYLCCAAKLLRSADRIYPQFATHNAHTAAAILEMAPPQESFEFQRLHGMGESLFNQLLDDGAACRIYAPVGPHKDLLAYLVRRLLENGANSSFVHKIVDPSISADEIAADPFDITDGRPTASAFKLPRPSEIFEPSRVASRGWDLSNDTERQQFDRDRQRFLGHVWEAGPLTAVPAVGGQRREIRNPAKPDELVGHVIEASFEDCEAAARAARSWNDAPAAHRQMVLNRAADLLELNGGELFALLAREAGKCASDAVAELREAVDFLRYYAIACDAPEPAEPLGVFTCISPWNFPLAIFTGQVAAALAAGNGVLAKPAETTPLIAFRAVNLLHEAGVPRDVLQLLPGDGPVAGTALTGIDTIGGVCFTGSTATARHIYQQMAEHLSPHAPLIAETGGINAAIVDSTALLEQAVRDTVVSAFQSAGQRCSALRVLYVQEDIAEPFLNMLFGAMDELELGDPWEFATDVGPVISAAARSHIGAYIEGARKNGSLRKSIDIPEGGCFVPPSVIEVSGIEEVEAEIFGPVLHVATFAAEQFADVLEAINGHGFGLTFGLHSRIDERVSQVNERLAVGNIYVNRNQIGAVVESQPFGGEGLSGTGPKAGGPHYLQRFRKAPSMDSTTGLGIEPDSAALITATDLATQILSMPELQVQPRERLTMPGPTGESNVLSLWPRGLVLCLGPTLNEAIFQAGLARRMGCTAIVVAPGAQGPGSIDGRLDLEALQEIPDVAVVALGGSEVTQRQARCALARRGGPLVPLVTGADLEYYCTLERHTCIDTTAAGGNASLLAAVDG